MREFPELSGPVHEPLSGGPARQLVILCHGVGSDGHDLIGLAPYFAKALPDAKFMAPNAPEKFDQAPFGYQWFSLGDMSMENRLAGTKAAKPVLDDFIDEQLAAHGLTERDLALVGFSQGAMVSLHTGLRRQHQLACIIGYSGMLVGEDILFEEIKSRPPVLLIHGDADDVLPPENLDLATNTLQSLGVVVRSEMRPGLGHGLDDHGIMMGMDFLAESFGVSLPDSAPVLDEKIDPIS